VPLGDTRCPGVSEPGLRSPLPHQGRATPRLVGSPAGACAPEAGVFGTQRIDRTRADRHEGLSPPFFPAVSHPRDANEQQREKTRRSTARAMVREDKRSAGGKRPRVVTITVAELTNARFLPPQGSASSRRAKVSSAEETRAFHAARCASRSRSRSYGPRNCARVARKGLRGTRGGAAARPLGKTTPEERTQGIH